MAGTSDHEVVRDKLEAALLKLDHVRQAILDALATMNVVAQAGHPVENRPQTRDALQREYWSLMTAHGHAEGFASLVRQAWGELCDEHWRLPIINKDGRRL